MIFATIGSLFPFDRLVRLIDELAPEFPQETFFQQIGDGAYEPKNTPFARWLSRREFKAKTTGAKLLIAHAGMGSVITAMELGKPILLLPRRQEWGEHTTDHQMATARWLAGRPGLYVCLEEADLCSTLVSALAHKAKGEAMSRSAPEPFVRRLHDYIMSA